MSIRFTDEDAVTRTTNLVGPESISVVLFFKRPVAQTHRSTLFFIGDGSASYFDIFEDATGNNGMAFEGNNGTVRFSPTVEAPVDEWCAVAVSTDASRNAIFRFRELDSDGWTAEASISDYATASTYTELLIGDSPFGGDQSFDGAVAGVKYWDAELTDAELLAETYRLTPIRKAGLQAFWPMLQGSSERLRDHGPNGFDLSVLGVSTLSDEEMPPVPWGGVVRIIQPVASVELTATDNSVSGSSSDLTIDHELTATAPSASGSSAALTVDHDLTATAPSASGASASLTVDHELTATAPSVSGASASLTIDHDLSSQADSVSGSTATILTGVTLSGTAPSVSGSSATLVIGDSFTGTAPSVSGSSAELAIAHDLSGQADSLSGASADIQIEHDLSSQADSVSGAVASLQIAHDLTGQADSVSGSSAALEVVEDLSGTAPSVSGSSATLILSHLLSGTITSQSGGIGTLLGEAQVVDNFAAKILASSETAKVLDVSETAKILGDSSVSTILN